MFRVEVESGGKGKTFFIVHRRYCRSLILPHDRGPKELGIKHPTRLCTILQSIPPSLWKTRRIATDARSRGSSLSMIGGVTCRVTLSRWNFDENRSCTHTSWFSPLTHDADSQSFPTMARTEPVVYLPGFLLVIRQPLPPCKRNEGLAPNRAG